MSITAAATETSLATKGEIASLHMHDSCQKEQGFIWPVELGKVTLTFTMGDPSQKLGVRKNECFEMGVITDKSFIG